MTVPIPFNFHTRTYQSPFWNAMMGEEGYKRAILLWHRRSGKDKTTLNFMILRMMKRVGIYYYFFPTYNQGRKILWDGIDKDGFKFMDHFPPGSVVRSNDTEMKKTLVNGSIFQIVGTDKFNSIVGTNPVGCVFSEYALQDPRAWAYIRPILRENGGWAIFPYTPRGKTHGHVLYKMAMASEDWYASKLTVDDTGVLSEADIQKERDEGVEEEIIQQEYYCSFDVGMQGSYFGKGMNLAETQGRICGVPYDSRAVVNTWWDLGMDDSTAIWFHQRIGKEHRFIDYFEDAGEGLGPAVAQPAPATNDGQRRHRPQAGEGT